MNDASRVGSIGVLAALISRQIADDAGVVRARWSPQLGSPTLLTFVDDDGKGPMAAAYGQGLADGQAGLAYHVPPARDGRVRFARCYRHGYEHGAAIRADSSRPTQP